MSTQERGLFLMLPDCLLDDETLSEKCIIGFARLMRYCQQNRTNIFTGSLSKLARVIKISKTSTYRLITTWTDRNLLTKDEDEDGVMTLTLHLPELWQENVIYCEEHSNSKSKHDNSNLEQNRSTVEHSNSNLEQIVPTVSTNEGTNTIRGNKKKEGEEEKKAPDETPSQKKTFQSPRSQNPQQQKLRLPHQGMAHSATPSQNVLDKRIREEVKRIIQDAYGPLDAGFWRDRVNVSGLDAIIEAHYDETTLRETIKALDDFEIRNFSIALLHKRCNTLAALKKRKESPPPAVELREVRPMSARVQQQIEEEQYILAHNTP